MTDNPPTEALFIGIDTACASDFGCTATVRRNSDGSLTLIDIRRYKHSSRRWRKHVRRQKMAKQSTTD